MTFLQSDTRLSIADFAKGHKVKAADLWLPLYLAPTAHSRADDPIMVRDNNALALFRPADQSLTYRRSDIAAALGLASLDAPETALKMDSIPHDCEVYIRWDRPGRKFIPADTRVLHRVLSASDAVFQGVVASAPVETRGRKRGVAASSIETESASLVDTGRRMTQRQADSAASRVDLARRLEAVVHSEAHGSLEQLRADTLRVIWSKRRLPPLHFVVEPSDAVILSASNCRWSRPDPRVIYHTFRASEGPVRRSVSRQFVFLFLTDVLLQFFDTNDVLTTSRDATTTTTTGDLLVVRRAALGQILKQHVQRGVTVCLVDHLPFLHHASKDEFGRVIALIEDLCRTHCDGADVSVVLSVLSNVSATTGANASFVLPHSTGLIHFIAAELNQSLQPDASTSIVVGTTQRTSAVERKQHADFATNARMRFVEVDAFLGLSGAAGGPTGADSQSA